MIESFKIFLSQTENI